MSTFYVTVYSGQYQEKIEIEARNQQHLKQRVRGLGYDRLGAIHKVK